MMKLEQLIIEAFAEDVPSGDITTEALKIDSYNGRAQLVAKEDLVLSGCDAFEAAVKHLQDSAEIRWHVQEGQLTFTQQTVATIVGDLIPLLSSERVALNFLGHLSGIATYTRCFVKEVEHTKCKILDTRKTTPLLRSLEKQAVVHGGGQNHRLNLSDRILVKENHIALAGSLRKVVDLLTESEQKFEIEVKTKAEALDAVELGAHHLLLDNMNLQDMAEVRKACPSTVTLEASGNMTLDRVRAVAETGVDFISVGALTHSAPCADISLLFDWKGGVN